MTDEEILNAHVSSIDDTAYQIMVKGKRVFLLDLIRRVREDERARQIHNIKTYFIHGAPTVEIADFQSLLVLRIQLEANERNQKDTP